MSSAQSAGLCRRSAKAFPGSARTVYSARQLAMIAKRMDNVRQLLKPFNLNRLRSKVLSRKSSTRQTMQTANKTRILCRGMMSPKRRRGTPRKIPAISIHRTSFIGIMLTLIVQNSGIRPLISFRSTSSKFLILHACHSRSIPRSQDIRILCFIDFFECYRLCPCRGSFLTIIRAFL
jgi:hypothetical protein